MARSAVRLTLVGGCLVGLLSGCSPMAREKLLDLFFDRDGSSRPPTTRVRQDLLKEIEDLKRQAAKAQEELKAAKEGKASEGAPLSVELAKTWEEAAELLPKDKEGYVDWVESLKAGAIAPRPGLDSKARDQGTLDLVVDFTSSGSRLYSATFSHDPHTRWLACGNCHPTIFPLKRGAEPTMVTMTKIQAGEFCGVCHGRIAFGIAACARCHAAAAIPARAEWRPPEEPRKPIERARTWEEAAKLLPVTAGAPDWAKALAEGVIAPRPGVDPEAADQPVFPITVERVPTGQEVFKAIFPHAAHTAWLGCGDCHPTIFKMARGATPINMGLIYAGQVCGACHGKVAFPVTACGRCHPAMATN